MRRLMGTLFGLVVSLSPALALAEGAGGSYKGIAQIYYAFISVILIYGVHDVFRNKKLTWIAAIGIPLVMYGLLLPKG